MICTPRALPAASSALALALCLLALPAAAGEKRLVILPLDTTKTSGKMTPESRASLEELLRGEAADQLAGTGWTVMTGDTTLRILTDSGIDPSKCGEGSCHLDTAKTMNVDKFISGAVQYAEGTYTASIRLIDTKTGDILASVQIEAETVKGLRKAFAEKKERFFQRSGLVEGAESVVPPASAAPAQGGAATNPVRVAQGTLKVVSNPSGAKVSIDGDAAGSTPLTAKRDAGTYVVSIELPGYAPVSKQVEVAGGKSVVVSESLMQAAGYIEVGVQPEAAARGASITVDGKAAGVGKQGPYKVGPHVVRVEAPGHKPAEQSVSVENGGTTPASFVLDALPGKLLVSVNVAAACSAGGVSVRANPESVTKVEVPAGSVQVSCSADGYDDATGVYEVAPGKAVSVKLALARVQGPKAGQTRVEPKSGLEFVYIPAGSFHMGCEPQDTQCYDNEKPGRTATVKPFWLGKTSVTVAAYAKCAAAGACEGSIKEQDTPEHTCNWKNARLDHPMNCLNWEEAQKFCAWAGGRLPTAEEWEYAAKSGGSRVYPWGNEPVTARRANYCDKNCPQALNEGQRKTWGENHWIDTAQDDGYAGTSPVGNYPAGASKWGLLDMAGNVWNWTATDYSTSEKELRGGAWNSSPRDLRASSRGRDAPTVRDVNLGLRCGL